MLYLLVALGIISRTLVPYLIELQQHPETKFDKKYLVPPLISIVLNLVASPLVFNLVGADTNLVNAYILGWGSTDILRDGLKFVGTAVPQLSKLV